MKANELRIGNYFMFGELRHKASYHDIANLYESALINKVPSGSYKPIPLTEDWLLKFGFELKDDINNGFAKPINEEYGTEHYYLYVNPKYFTTCLIDNKKPHEIFINSVKYVHQLQNLYFALTGEELKL